MRTIISISKKYQYIKNYCKQTGKIPAKVVRGIFLLLFDGRNCNQISNERIKPTIARMAKMNIKMNGDSPSRDHPLGPLILDVSVTCFILLPEMI